MDPLIHYLKYGHLEGRDPGPKFSTKAYYFLHEDVKNAGQIALVHYEQHGRKEGRLIFSSEEGKRILSTESGRKMLAAGKRFGKGFSKKHAMNRRKEPATGGIIPVSFPLVRPVSNAWGGRSVFSPTSKPGQIELGGAFIGAIGQAADADPSALNGPLTAFCALMGRDAAASFRFTAVDANAEAWNLTGPFAGACDAFLFPAFAGKTDVSVLDLWHVSDMHLRLRLEGAAPGRDPASAPVIRLFQADPLRLDRLSLLAERPILENGPVVLDVPLTNPFLPMLVCVNSASGELQALSLLPFPSLCRGGAHYGELLATCEARSDMDNLADLSGRYLTARLGQPAPQWTIDRICVQTGNALGSERIFRPDIRLWAAVCFNLPIMPAGDPASDAGTGETELIQSLLEWPQSYAPLSTEFRAKGSPGADGCLTLAADCIPSIGIMVAGDGRESLVNRPMALAVTDAPTAVPAWSLTRGPANPSLKSGSLSSSHFPSLGPIDATASKTNGSAISETGGALCMAVRFANLSHPDEVQLLMPFSPETSLPGAGSETRPRVSVFIACSGKETALRAALQALFLQDGIDICDVVLSVPEDDEQARQIAATVSEMEAPCSLRVSHRPETSGPGDALISAAADMTGDQILAMSDAVVLHDPRTLSLLAGMIAEQVAASASCMLVEQVKVEKKVERPEVRSYGYFLNQPITDRSAPISVWEPGCQGLFLREDYPVFANHGDLFLTEKATLAELDGASPALVSLSDVALKIGSLAYGKGLQQIGTSVVSAGVTKGVLPPVDRTPFEVLPGLAPSESAQFHPNDIVIRMLDT
ncbi:hypothetical protein [uncultured Roseibium sp.]|uniref:glycosyltransferase n=1 Tax=uncultured Roseibium sp. TaxID=1936171 RepID=UPI00321703D3